MTAHTRYRSARLAAALSAAVLTLGLAGCAPAASEAEADAPTGTAEAEAPQESAATSGCPTPAESDLVPFSSDLVTSPIPEGAVYGDGSTISFTTSLGEGFYPNMALLYWVDDTVTTYIEGNWDDAGGGTYTNNLLVFDSDLDGQPGLVEVSVFADGVTFDGERYEGENVVLGIYCITYAVE